MTGFILAGIASFLWAIVNIIDKSLVEKYCQDEGVGPLIVLSALFPTILLPVSLFMAEESIWIPSTDIMILIFSGFLTISWISLYLKALYDDDVSIVMPLMQLTPVFALLLGFLFLGEWPPLMKLIAGGVIVIGSLVLSIEQTTGKIKGKLLLSMAGASAIIALTNTLFKFVTVEETFWVSMFWHSVGIVIIGVGIYSFHNNYRRQFHTFIKKNWGVGLSLNAVNESLTVAGDVLFTYAILLAPLALVQSMEAYQPVFVFFIGLILTKISPDILKEDTGRNAIIQKVLGITLVVIGTVWMLT